jgi:hypothetical protein
VETNEIPIGGIEGFANAPPFSKKVSDLNYYNTLLIIDEDITISDTLPAVTNSTLSSLEGRMSRSRARHLNFEMHSLLMLQSNTHEDWILLNSCDVILLRNMGSTNKPASSSTPSLQSSDNNYKHKTEFA